MFENILNGAELVPVVHKSVVVLYAAVNTAVQENDLICVSLGPSGFACGITFFRAKPSVAQSLDEFS